MNNFGDFTATATCTDNCDPFNSKTYEWTMSVDVGNNVYQNITPDSLFTPCE
jgi:hypothetical protein